MQEEKFEKNDIILQTASACVFQVVSEPIAEDQALTALDRRTAGKYYFIRKVGFSEIVQVSVEDIESGYRLFVTPKTLDLVPAPATPALFVKHQTMLHVKSGKKYTVVGTPDEYRIEGTGEAAYAYRGFHCDEEGEYSELPHVWVRKQTEFEDGRFIVVGNYDEHCRLRLIKSATDTFGVETKASIHSLTTEPTRGTS